MMEKPREGVQVFFTSQGTVADAEPSTLGWALRKHHPPGYESDLGRTKTQRDLLGKSNLTGLTYLVLFFIA